MKNFKTRYVFIAFVVLSTGFSAFRFLHGRVTGGKAGGREKLVITGSSTLAPLVAEMAKRFEKQHPLVRVDVQTGGSSRGISDVRDRVSQIGMVSRDLKADEQDLTGVPIAVDGLGVIVHKSNPVAGITSEQIAGIYTGRIRNWRELNGQDARITVVNKAEGRATLELFLNHFKLKNGDVKPDVIIGDNEQGIKIVAGNPHAIAYVSIGIAAYDAVQGLPIKLLALDGTEATVENVQAGAFPLSRRLILVTRGRPQGTQLAFIEFAKSEAVQDLVRGQQFVSVPD